jgi:hypothetical protein
VAQKEVFTWPKIQSFARASTKLRKSRQLPSFQGWGYRYLTHFARCLNGVAAEKTLAFALLQPNAATMKATFSSSIESYRGIIAITL